MKRLLLLLLCCGFFLPVVSAQTQITREYAVILQDPPVGRQISSRYELRSAKAVSHAAKIEQAQQELRRALASRNVRVLTSVKTLLNAVFVLASPEQVPALRTLPGVVRVAPLHKMKLHMNAALPLVRGAPAWSALSIAGFPNPGAGVKIGIIDTGIDQNHPAFQDPSLQPPAGYPLCTGDTVAKTGDCAYTSNKVIVARSYVWMTAQGYSDPANGVTVAETSSPDDLSPRDRVGHGTATAMVAAGAENQAPLAKLSGIAPKAFLGNYKVFGSPGVNDGTRSSAVIKALEDAYNDDMDIVSLSLGFPAWYGPNDKGADCGDPNPNAPCEVEAQTVETAVANGMVVVVSAGNDGDYGLYVPTLSSIGTPGISPSAITVGASRNGHEFFASVSAAGTGAPDNVRNLAASFGDGPLPSAPLTAPLRDLNGLGCTAISGTSLTGAIALIQRGSCYFSDKVANAEAAGSVGVIFYCDDTQYCADGGETPFSPSGVYTASIPAVLVGRTSGRNLKSYVASNPNAQVTLNPTVKEYTDPDLDTVAAFSSRGPSIAPETALKPEVVGPGTNVYMAAQHYDTNGVMYSSDGYTVQNGTSFSAPMAAGIAALVKQKNPHFTAGQIKSAVVNTAAVDVQDGSALAGVAAVGAGKLNAEGAVKTNVTVEPATLAFGVLTQAIVTPGSSAGMRTLRVTNNSNSAVTLAVVQGDPDPNLHLKLSAASVAPGQASNIQVTLEGTLPLAGSYGGAVTITGGAVNLRVPFHYLVGDGVPDNVIPVTGQSFDGTINERWYRAVRVIDRYGAAVVNAPVAWSATNGATIDPDPYYASDSTTHTYGFAGAFALLGPTPDTHQAITATIGSGAGAMKYSFDAFPRGIPVVGKDANGQLGVVNGASFVAQNGSNSALAPGSYISLFGTTLSDFEAQFSWYLPKDYIYLPLSLAGVTVSFDAGTISVPGHLSYVNPGQINVQVPWELQGQTSADIKVTLGGSVSDVYNIKLADAAPGIFEFDPYGTGLSWAAAQHPTQPTYTAIGPSKPAGKGEVIVVWANGLGPVENQPASGELSPGTTLAKVKAMPMITIGGKAVNQIDFAGLSPGFVGLYQINLKVPDDAPSGAQDMVITVNGNQSKAARLFIQ